MLPDKIEHCIVIMNYWDVSGVFWSFSKCNIKIPHLPADPSKVIRADLHLDFSTSTPAEIMLQLSGSGTYA